MESLPSRAEPVISDIVASRRIFLSDIHASAGWGLDVPAPRHDWEWLTRSDADRFVAFASWLCQRADAQFGPLEPVSEVVLLGDIFDNWSFPADVKPPTMDEILQTDHAQKVIGALDAVSRMIPTIYFPGNHDMWVTAEQIARVLPKVTYGGSGEHDPFFSNGRTRAEHGHSHALFCSQDPLGRVPLGYFISRAASKADRDFDDHTPRAQDVIRELLEDIGHDSIAVDVMQAVCKQAGLTHDDFFRMPDDVMDGEKIRVGDVITRYASLLSQWRIMHGTVRTALAVPAEIGRLELVADNMFLAGGTNAMVMGHTHTAMVQQIDVPFLGTAAYANSGCWIGGREKATWVEQCKVVREGKPATLLTVKQIQGVDSEGFPTGISTLCGPVCARGA